MNAAAPVVVEVRGRVGRLTLNRPEALNALTHEMVTVLQTALDDWREDARVQRIELVGAGDRALCAGADVRRLRELLLLDPGLVLPFFDDEYRLVATLAHHSTPISAHLEGITMGGGLGLSLHVPHRVGTHSSRLAMPEVGIGFFPDVGVLWPASRMPGGTGAWWVLSGASLDSSSAVWAGLLTEADERALAPEESWLAGARPWIDECFVGDDPRQVLERLADHPHPEARRAGELVASRSPLAVAVTLEALRRAERMGGVDEVLAQDALLVRRYLPHSDFVEGVRAQLVDKDRNPRWRHRSVDEVSRDEVLGFFAS